MAAAISVPFESTRAHGIFERDPVTHSVTNHILVVVEKDVNVVLWKLFNITQKVNPFT